MSVKSASNTQKSKNEMEKYDVIKVLGEGSFGRVYKARVLSDSTFVALKIISKARRSDKEVVALRRECEIQRRLHHPNIIKMLDSFETPTEIVVVTEFVPKELNSVLSKEGYLPEKRARPLIWDLVSALNYLHSHRVLHRDLKPQNVLIDSKNHAKLCDFGFARSMSAGTHILTSIKGTPLYMAPELIKEQPYDYKADLWSLGCIAYEILVGSPPFSTNSILHLFRLVQHEQIQWPTFVSDHCVSFLKGLLQKDPCKRIDWEKILNHEFVKGHVLICSDSTNMPLTKTPSENTLQVKEQQRMDHLSNKSKAALKQQSEEAACLDNPSPQNVGERANKSTNLTLSTEIANLSLEDSTKKFSFIEDSHPIETEEWIVFLRKTMKEIKSAEVTSLTQSSLTNVIVSPLRNCNTSPKVLTYISKLFSFPFVVKEIPEATLEQIKKVYLEVKLVPNLVYSSKLLLRSKRDNTPSPVSLTPEDYKTLDKLTVEDFEAFERIFMLITHLVYLEHDFLVQLCDAIAIFNISAIWKLLLINKQNQQVVIDVIAILTHILRVFPEESELIDNIFSGLSDKAVVFIDFLRHSDATLRGRACFLLLFLGRADKLANIWNENVKETLEALMYDSIESVRIAAERTVEELKDKEFYQLD